MGGEEEATQIAGRAFRSRRRFRIGVRDQTAAAPSMQHLAAARDAALKKASQAKHAAQNIDIDHLKKQAAATASSLSTQASNLAGDLMDKVSTKEVVTIEGHGPFMLVKQLAEGGFGFVYLGRHTQSGEEFAIKRMLVQDRDTQRQAAAEVEMMKSLQHPNIVRLFASSSGPRGGGLPGGEFLLLMELAGNGTLARWVTPTPEGEMPPPISEERLLACFNDTCKAVAYMHARDPPLTHYDMKLENVLETARGTCKLCDFGSSSTRTFNAKTSDRRARLEEEDKLSRFSTMMNRSPEMMDLDRGVVGPPSDVWALGCMLCAHHVPTPSIPYLFRTIYSATVLSRTRPVPHLSCSAPPSTRLPNSCGLMLAPPPPTPYPPGSLSPSKLIRLTLEVGPALPPSLSSTLGTHATHAHTFTQSIRLHTLPPHSSTHARVFVRDAMAAMRSRPPRAIRHKSLASSAPPSPPTPPNAPLRPC